jgi:hypothetical protein
MATVQQYFDKWIEKKIEPLFRRGLIRDYKQHFWTHILLKFKHMRLSAIGTRELKEFQVRLLAFTAEERGKIIDYWAKEDFFYFPQVLTLFHTGMRPSEVPGLAY